MAVNLLLVILNWLSILNGPWNFGFLLNDLVVLDTDISVSFFLFEASSRNIYLWTPHISNLCCKYLQVRCYCLISIF